MKYLSSAVLLVTLAGSASAQLILPVSETREISSFGSTEDPKVSDFDAASDTAVLYEYFAAAVSSTAEIDTGLSNAGAIQDSFLGAESITGSGSSFCASESYSSDTVSESGSASVLVVDFVLTEKASFRWHGDISATDNGATEIALFGGGFSTSAAVFGPSEALTIDESGVLEPGSYTLDIRATGFGTAVDGFDYAFSDYQLSLEFTRLSGNYCVSAPNSAGSGAAIVFGGSQSIAENDFTLGVSGARPNGSGLFFYGPNPIQVPFGDGFRCIGGQTYRLQPPVMASGLGVILRPVDFTAPPANGASGGAILPGSTWNFQLWYRDPGGPGGSGFNLSNALWATFCD